MIEPANKGNFDLDKLGKFKWHFIHKRSRTPLFTYMLWEGLSHHTNKDLDFPYEMSPIIYLDQELAFEKSTWDKNLVKSLNEFKKRPEFIIEMFEKAYKLNSNIEKIIKKINTTNFTELKDKKLAELFDDYSSEQMKSSAFMILPMAMEKYLEDTIFTNIRKVLPQESSEAIQVISTSEKQSSSQSEEISILKIAIKKRDGKDIKDDIEKHILEFGWLKNASMDGQYYSSSEILEKVEAAIKIKPESKLKEIKDERKKVTESIKKYKEILGREDSKIPNLINILQEAIFFRSWRTERFYRNTQYLQDFLTELSKRLGLSNHADIFYLLPKEIINLLNTSTRANSQTIEDRKLGYIMYADGKSTEIYSGSIIKLAKEKIKLINVENDSKIIKGQTAYPGKVTGKACIIHRKTDFPKMQSGDILVSHSTTPDYVPLLQKAIAIITDEGGVLSHASVISREMKIPCIIGTQTASKTLKDGDMVEVDANTGMIRLVSASEDNIYEPSGELLNSRARPKKTCLIFPANFTQEYIGTDEMRKEYGARAHSAIYTWIGEDIATATDSQCEFETIGKIILNKCLDEKGWLNDLVKWSEKQKDTLMVFIERSFPKDKLSSLTNKYIAEKYTEYCERYINFHLKNCPVWWVGMPTLEKELDDAVEKRKISKDDLIVLIESLSYAYDLSKEEEEILKISNKIKKTGNISLKKIPANIDKLLDKHVKEYSSIPFGYNTGVLWDKKYFINKIKNILSKGDPEKELKRRSAELKLKRQRQKELLIKLNLEPRLKKIIDIAHKLGYLQDLKKVFQTKSHPHLQLVVIPEISKRLDISPDHFNFLTPLEIKDSLITGVLDNRLKGELSERAKDSILISHDHKYEWIVGDKAIAFAKKYNLIVSSDNVKELKGRSASSGITTGIVKVCSSSKDIVKINKGDILVASMTTPDYVPAMKIAGAIITDEGGITCHAAIVSRELHIPCIIGTKNATKVLKDGDIVEVDADKGIVKIIK
jgi:phosphohistidine swiveling domain-containing protein